MRGATHFENAMPGATHFENAMRGATHFENAMRGATQLENKPSKPHTLVSPGQKYKHLGLRLHI